MKVSLNLKPLQVPDKLETLLDVIDYMEQQGGLPEGHVIKHIILDGQDLDEQAEQENLSKSVKEIELLEFHSARPVDIAIEGLQAATQLLPSLAEDLAVVAADLRSGSVQDGLLKFSICADIINWYTSLISPLDVIFSQLDPSFRLRIDLDDSDEHSPEAELGRISKDESTEMRTFASVENLRQNLMEVERAQRNADTLLLADLVEYEVLPIVNIWVAEVPLLLKKVERESGSA
jgi:hypothetical protein